MTDEGTEWFRPEFKGRDRELITYAEAAIRAGVNGPTVSNWARRYENFPALVKTVEGAGRPKKYIHVDEFDEFVIERITNRPRHPRNGPRPGVAMHSQELNRCTRAVEDLERRKAALEAKLSMVTAELDRARDREAIAVEKLAKELFDR